ncbi:IRS-type PTB domain-containing protein [Caenorhabditis elegans]|uniref:IRS-type PTB domain-containing protein n=2 Tax=Caenorhabditis elegans TaxID=6239 RepID=A0A1C3NSK8_CAEEL|nr:IRS-type PTB domain-containing protein [Caenorhabditis elegans]SBV53385.1 IRS-type PTB domain-containing protein [Caenorhabditis elegans]|eukprot:NP_001317892.1 Insulin receptor SubsTrate homolog [Caenorhabditis elegans]
MSEEEESTDNSGKPPIEHPHDREVKSEKQSSNVLPGILRRAESTDDAHQVRRSSMRPYESFDGLKNDGILKRKRSFFVKTVSFSATVSELMLPAEPTSGEPKNDGEYVETMFDATEEKKQETIAPKQEETVKKLSMAAREERIRESRQQGQLKEKRLKNPDSKGDTSHDKPTRETWKPLAVEDLPKDEDPDEFGIPEVYKCGNCLVGFAPVKKKKLMFVTLTERCLELHESEKSYRAGKAAKHMVDLSMSFNVHSEHYDAKLKKCLCLMGPDETICMRPEGGILTIEGWRRAIVKLIHESRRRKMDRVPRPEDIFDAAYDVRVCLFPKNLEKYVESLKTDGFTNICTVAKELLGKKRLCLYPNTLAIVDLCIEPTAYGLPPAGFPPFRASSMFILERNTVAYYGFRENYFYVRIGKGSPYRGFELLFQVDTNEVCKEIYSRLRALADRDLENRKQESIRRPERPRVSTLQSVKPGKEETGLREALLESYGHLRKKNSTQSERGEIVVPEQERKMSDNRPRLRTQDIKTVTKPELKSEEPIRPRLPPLKFNANKPSGEFLLSLQREKELMEEARKNGYDGRTHNPDGTPREIKKDFLDTVCPQAAAPEVVIKEKIINNDTYTLMGPADWGKLEDIVKDDYSDSGDSCYSSRRGTGSQPTRPAASHLACQMQNRTQSFGAKQQTFQNRLPPTVNLPDSERKISAANQGTSNQLDLPQEDPRKRAFSLGSKNFFNLIGLNDFRRLVSKRHRTSSPNHTSTSGISLNSSNASPSASSNFLASSEYLEHARTDSFGSARSSPKSLHTQRTSSPKRRSDEDLISIDFSRLGKNSASDTKRFPFGGGGPGGSFDYDREKREKEDNNRRDREKAAMDLKRKEEWEARELAEKKRELERKIQAKKDRKLEKGRGKDREKDKDHDHDKEFRPKADSGIADCTPSSSFSGKKDHKNDGSSDSAYMDKEGLKYLADIKKRKKEQGAIDTTNSSSSSLSTIVSIEDNKVTRRITETVETKVVTADLAKALGAIDPNRRSSACIEINRKPSICTAIMEEREGEASETDSRGEPSDRKTTAAPVTRKPASTGSSMSPFRRLKFLSFRK